MSKALKHMGEAERREAIARRLAQPEEVHGLGYLSAVDAQKKTGQKSEKRPKKAEEVLEEV